LACASRIIKANNGVITAFDGDRVMAVYVNKNRHTDAARTALQINCAVKSIVNVMLKETYKDEKYEVRQTVGIDSSDLFVARTGIRKYNDLVWVGRSANMAAKLCSLRNGAFASFITEEVYSKMDRSAKVGGNPKTPIWEKVYWKEQKVHIYRSSWTWALA